MRGKSSEVVVAFAAILIAVLVGGCGGDSGTTETTVAESAGGSAPGSGTKSSFRGEVNEGFRKGILSLGEPDSEVELEDAAVVVSDYFVARAEEDWRAVCANLTKKAIDQVDLLAAQSANLKGMGCAGILEALPPHLPPKVQRESTVVDAGSLRLEGESEGAQAFLVYRGAKHTRYAISMAKEDGAWKVGTLMVIPIS